MATSSPATSWGPDAIRAGHPLLAAVLLAGLLAGCASDPAPAPPRALEAREDAQTFTLPAGRSIEWKLRLDEGSTLDYSWSASRPVAFDFHGDHDDGTEAFVSHKSGTLASDRGAFTTPFEGRHGWFWDNRNAQTVSLTLTTKGAYEVVGRTGGDAP